MSEDKFEEVKDKAIDEDCEVKDGKAVEKINPIKHPFKAAKAFKEKHPRVCAGMTLAAIVAVLIYVYKKGYDANAKIFEGAKADADIPAADPELIETNSETTEVPETTEAAETVNVQ